MAVDFKTTFSQASLHTNSDATHLPTILAIWSKVDQKPSYRQLNVYIWLFSWKNQSSVLTDCYSNLLSIFKCSLLLLKPLDNGVEMTLMDWALY